MKRRFEGGPGESAEGENPIPAQPTKLRDADKNKEKISVKDSPTTHLTKVEAAQDSQTQLQLEEKNTLPSFLKEDNNPTCLARPKLIIKPGTFSSMPSTCRICSEYGHFPGMCPWRKRLPKGVTQVGKGYVVKWGRAVFLECVSCYEIGTHMLNDCPHFKKLLEENGGDAPCTPVCSMIYHLLIAETEGTGCMCAAAFELPFYFSALGCIYVVVDPRMSWNN